MVSDARLAGRDVHQVVERLLSVSGEDLLTVDRKYREPWTGKLPSRFLILSNELPRFGDASGAIANRFVVLTMTESFLGRENTSLTDAADQRAQPASFPGRSRAWTGIARRGKFTEPKSSLDAILALQDLVSPVAAFRRDRCEVGVGFEVNVKDLFGAWKDWAENNGHKPGSVQSFGRDIRAVIPTLRQGQRRDGDERERYYLGVRLNTVTHNEDSRVTLRDSTQSEAVSRDVTRTTPLWPVHDQACPDVTDVTPRDATREPINGVPVCRFDGCSVQLVAPDAKLLGLCFLHRK